MPRIRARLGKLEAVAMERTRGDIVTFFCVGEEPSPELQQVMETAEADSRRLKHETEDFLDQRLGSFEILLDKLQKTVGAGRQRLSIGGAVDETTAVEEDDPTKGFFDQDH